MNLFTKLFGRKKKKKKHHVPATKPVVCDDCVPQECECVIDDREQPNEAAATDVTDVNEEE